MIGCVMLEVPSKPVGKTSRQNRRGDDRVLRAALAIRTYDIDFAGIVGNIVLIRWLKDPRLERIRAAGLNRVRWRLAADSRFFPSNREFYRFSPRSRRLGAKTVSEISALPVNSRRQLTGSSPRTIGN
jgi:hypothetical protein